MTHQIFIVLLGKFITDFVVGFLSIISSNQVVHADTRLIKAL